MIRHHVQKSAAAAKKYYARADYYAPGHAAPANELGGKAAGLLGVAGPAEKLHFERLCDNLHPVTGEQLSQRTRADRIVGIDITFDTPKSVAVLEALTPDPRLAEARRAAALETMREIELSAAVRIRKGGRDENRTTGNLVWYRAEHDTTRPVDGVPDMQPHEHYFVLSASFDPVERQWKSLNAFDIIRDMHYHQAAYHQRLATKLEALGYPVERKGIAFEVVGVGELTKKFSRRKDQVEARAKEKGITAPDLKAKLGAETREHKADGFTPDQLRRIWAARLTAAEREALSDVHWRAKRHQEGGAVSRDHPTAREAMEYAAAHVFERKSSAPASELLAHALAYGVGGFSVEEARAELESGDRFTAAVDGRLHVASRKVLAEERELVRLARAGKGTLPAVNPDWEIQDHRLEADQRGAAHHLVAGSHDFVTMLVGDAGAGKTTALSEAKRAVEAAGGRVVAVAPSAQASRTNLRNEGFPDAQTVAALFTSRELRERARGQVILVDEAAMLGTAETAQLFRTARDLGTRVWLVGDDKQHRAVTRGSPFELLQRDAGITPARLAKIRRQRDRGYKRLVELARDRPSAAVKRLSELGWVEEVGDADRYRQLAADYLSAVEPERRKVGGEWKDVTPSALVVAPTHTEGRKVTAAIRDGLRERGRLGEEREFVSLTSLQLTEAQRADPHSYQTGDILQFVQNAKGHRRGERVELAEGIHAPTHLAARFQAYRPGTLRLAAGDRVRVTAGGTDRAGKRLDNGDLFTVAGFTPRGDILTEGGRLIPRDYGHLAHGYTTTSMAGQSRTVERVLVALGPDALAAANRRQLYVDLSRGREWARVYTHDTAALGRAAERDERQVSATELHRLRRQQARQARVTEHLRLRLRRAAAEPTTDTRHDRTPERMWHHAR